MEKPEVLVWGIMGFRKPVSDASTAPRADEDEDDGFGGPEREEDTEIVGASVFGSLFGNP